MSKYIELEKALESIDLIAENDGEKFDKDSARYAIQTTETADVQEVKHGEWLFIEDRFRCSVCDAAIPKVTTACNKSFINETYKYCRWCGAKMDAKNEK